MSKNSQIISLDDSNFSSNIQGHETELILVDFWAEWCTPCKMFAPVLEEIAVEYDKKVKFGKLNVDGNPLIVKQYNIRSIPTLLLFQDGIVISTKIGVLSKKQVQDLLDSKLKCKMKLDNNGF